MIPEPEEELGYQLLIAEIDDLPNHPYRCRDAAKLVFVLEMTITEAAEQLEVSRTTASRWLKTAQSHLRRRIQI